MSTWDYMVISIFNNKYRPYSSQSNVLSFRTFGSHDFVTLTAVNNENKILEEMQNNTIEITEKLKPGESLQNLYAIAANSDSADTFWSIHDDEDYPFLFISTIQFKYRNHHMNLNEFNKSYQKLNEYLYDKKKNNELYKHEINQLISEKNDKIENMEFDFQLYFSLDCNDLILFIKTHEYKAGAYFIQLLQQKCAYIYYTYSLVGINENMIDTLVKNNKEIIPQITISTLVTKEEQFKKWVENNFKQVYRNNVRKFVSRRKNEYIIFSRLGNEDICINIFHCRLSKFMRNIRKGIFSVQNNDLKDSCLRLRIQFDCLHINLDHKKKGGSQKKSESIFQGYQETRKNDEVSSIIEASIDKALMEIFTACTQLDLKNFALDVLACIRNVYDLFIKEIENYKKEILNSDENKKVQYQAIFNASLQHYTSGIMSIINGCLNADKMFFKSLGFNVVLYNIPAKLIVFYTSFVNSLSECFIGEHKESEYAYLLAPNLYRRMEIVKLFDYTHIINKTNLYKVRIPVKKLFAPRTLMKELAHETAHVSGEIIRCREQRFMCMVEMIAYVISENLLGTGKFINDDKANLYNNAIRELLNGQGEQIRQKTVNFIADEIDKGYRRKASTGFPEGVWYYGHYVKMILKEVTSDFLRDYVGSEGIQNKIEEYMRKQNNNSEKYHKNIKVYEYNFDRQIWYVNKELIDIIDACFQLTYESYADLTMITSLGISEEDYIQHFIDIFNTSGINDMTAYLSFGIGERLISVLETVYPNNKTLHIGNEKETIKNLNKDYTSFIMALTDFRDEDQRAHRLLVDKVIEINSTYLKCCQKVFEKHLDKEKIDSLKRLYSEVSSDSPTGFQLMREETYRYQERQADTNNKFSDIRKQ